MPDRPTLDAEAISLLPWDSRRRIAQILAQHHLELAEVVEIIKHPHTWEVAYLRGNARKKITFRAGRW